MKDSYGYFRPPFVYNITSGIRERCNEENCWKTESRQNTRNKASFVKASRLFPSTAPRFHTTARLNVTRANHDNKVYSYDDPKHGAWQQNFSKIYFTRRPGPEWLTVTELFHWQRYTVEQAGEGQTQSG